MACVAVCALIGFLFWLMFKGLDADAQRSHEERMRSREDKP